MALKNVLGLPTDASWLLLHSCLRGRRRVVKCWLWSATRHSLLLGGALWPHFKEGPSWASLSMPDALKLVMETLISMARLTWIISCKHCKYGEIHELAYMLQKKSASYSIGVFSPSCTFYVYFMSWLNEWGKCWVPRLTQLRTTDL